MSINHTIEKYLSYLAEKSRDVFWVRSDDYSRQIYLSPIFEKVWGRPVQAIYDNPKQWGEFLHPDDLSRMHSSIEMRGSQIKPDKEILERYRITRPDGSIRHIVDTSFPIFEGSKLIGFAGIARDVTEVILHQEKLEQALQQADAASLAKSEFIANMSHDLRTPMAGVMGMLTEVNHRVVEAANSLHSNPQLVSTILADIKRYVEIAQGSSEELLKMFNSVLELISIESGRIKEAVCSDYSLHDLLDSKVELFSSALTHSNLNLSLFVEPNVPDQVHGSLDNVSRIIVNLLSNAIKFTESGEIIVRVSMVHENDLPYFKLCVEDTGVGIPSDKFEEIFKHFSRLTPSYEGVYEGSGLGLYAVKKYIDQMDGRIEVDSVLGQGSRFTVLIPYQAPVGKSVDLSFERVIDESRDIDSVGVSREEQVRPDVPASRLILLVEDNHAIAMSVIARLNREGCVVDHVSTGESALQALDEKEYVLVLMDLGLPDLSGVDTVKALRQRGEEVPIVAFTGHVDCLPECVSAGMQGLIQKPLREKDIESLMAKYINQQATCGASDIIDWQGSIELCGNQKTAIGLATTFAKQLQIGYRNMGECLQKDDFNAMHDVLQSSRAGLCYLRCPDLAYSINVLSHAFEVKEQDGEFISRAYQALGSAVDRFLGFLACSVEEED